MTFLSNDWITWFVAHYSLTLAMVPSVVYGALKIIAVFKPSVENDKVRDLIQEWFPKADKASDIDAEALHKMLDQEEEAK